MSFESYTVRVTEHGHQQYCSRVAAIDKDELQQLLTEQITGPVHHKREYILLDGVWWVFEIVESVMIYITCYGRTHIDIPSALRWARYHNDRIDLQIK